MVIRSEKTFCLCPPAPPRIVIPGRGAAASPEPMRTDAGLGRRNLQPASWLRASHQGPVFIGSGPGPLGPSRNDDHRTRLVYPVNEAACSPAVSYFVYLLASRRHGTLYLGVTRDLVPRVGEHKAKAVRGFTAQYGVDRLVWFEVYDNPTAAITREKAIKKWRRDWKIRLIEEHNAEWRDLLPT